MALIDSVYELFDGVALGAAGATNSSVVNLGTTEESNMIYETLADDVTINPKVRDKGAGKPLYVNVQIGTADVVSAGAATLQLVVQQSTVVGMTSPDALITTQVFAKASLTAGLWVVSAILPTVGLKQFIRVVATVGVATITAGTLEGWIGSEPPTRIV